MNEECKLCKKLLIELYSLQGTIASVCSILDASTSLDRSQRDKIYKMLWDEYSSHGEFIIKYIYKKEQCD